jgi:hypothetical protein
MATAIYPGSVGWGRKRGRGLSAMGAISRCGNDFSRRECSLMTQSGIRIHAAYPAISSSE